MVDINLIIKLVIFVILIIYTIYKLRSKTLYFLFRIFSKILVLLFIFILNGIVVYYIFSILHYILINIQNIQLDFSLVLVCCLIMIYIYIVTYYATYILQKSITSFIEDSYETYDLNKKYALYILCMVIFLYIESKLRNREHMLLKILFYILIPILQVCIFIFVCYRIYYNEKSIASYEKQAEKYAKLDKKDNAEYIGLIYSFGIMCIIGLLFMCYIIYRLPNIYPVNASFMDKLGYISNNFSFDTSRVLQQYFTIQQLQQENNQLRNARDMVIARAVIGDPDDIPDVSENTPKEALSKIYKGVVDKIACVVCLEKFVNMRVMPCGHQCICKTCYDRLVTKECPVCRTPINDILPVIYN